jgi:glycosyltransferase involved in cell wall biosynthesis
MICPNFYPRTCGVGDFSARLAHELDHRGFNVTIHSRVPLQAHPAAPEIPVVGHRDAGPISIARGICRAILASRPSGVIVHYTPQMWNAWRLGSPAVPWLIRRLRRGGIPVFVIAHELYFSLGIRPDVFASAILMRIQLAAILQSCNRLMVTTETRQRDLLPYCRAAGFPIPGVIRVGANAMTRPRNRDGRRARLGMFSSAAVGKRFDVLLAAFERIARERPDAELVLIGDLGPPSSPGVRAVMDAVGSHPAAGRIRLTGRLELDEVAREIEELDVYLCALDSGANTRSSTLPSALRSGIPVVAVHGVETDLSLFRDRENVLFASELTGPKVAAAALEILGDSLLADRLSVGARALYERYLSWSRIADQLLGHMGVETHHSDSNPYDSAALIG